MNELNCCPFCEGDYSIKEVECQSCHTQIKGSFKLNRFHMFKPEDLYFIEIFLKNEGNIKLMEKDLGVSYPTVKGRLKTIISNLGYDTPVPKTSSVSSASSENRVKILKELSSGKIDVKAAMKDLGNVK